jgi:hypothetical protein
MARKSVAQAEAVIAAQRWIAVGILILLVE